MACGTKALLIEELDECDGNPYEYPDGKFPARFGPY